MSFLITPNNSELLPFKDHSYLVYKTDQGLNKKAFNRLMTLTEIKLSYYARVAIIRIDLHPPSFTPDNKIITSFLTKQIKKFEKEYCCLVSYYYTREKNKSDKQHYHLALFFSGHQVNSPHNISQEIKKNWIAHSQGSIHFVEKPFYMIERGNKLSLKQAIYRLSYLVKNKTKENPIKVFDEAINKIRPNLEVRSRRVGGATYQVPQEVKIKRSQTLALRWLLEATRKRKNKKMSDKLINELMDAYQKKGIAIKKREDVHRMAESNKAFAHFRW